MAGSVSALVFTRTRYHFMVRERAASARGPYVESLERRLRTP